MNLVAYSFKKQFIEPIMAGLEIDAPEIRPKRQTIRAMGKRQHVRPGGVIQLYTAMRTKQCRKLGEARCVSVEGVLLKWSEWPSFCTFDIQNGRRIGATRPIEDMEEFARADGFIDFGEMKKFWAEEHGGATFEGVLIKWEKISG